jgi:DNA-directed RNA polymerase specialized sigma24 family protein
MEELTSGYPDDWPDAGELPDGRPAVLDLTDDVLSLAPGSDTAADPTAARGLALTPPVPAGPPRIRFSTFVVQHADRLLGTAYLLTGDPGRAEELLRSALAAAGATWSHSRREPAADVLRAMARRCLGPLWWWGQPMDAAPLPGEVGSGLALLEGRHRVALVLRYHQRLTEEETAAALGAPVGNVRSWLSRALDRLGIDTRLDLRPEAGPGLSRGGLTAELAALTAPVAVPEPVGVPTGVQVSSRPPEPSAEVMASALAEAARLDTRLTDVRGRLPAYRRRERHRRAGIRFVVAAAAVAVIAGGLALAGPVPDPMVDDGTITVPMPPVTIAPKATDPFDFQFSLAGDPLLASRVGRAGQDELVLRFTPHITNLAFSAFCRTAVATGLWLNSTLNGHALSREPCGPDSAADAQTIARDDYPQVTDAGWADLGVRPGRESELLLSLTNRRGEPRPRSMPAPAESVRPGRPLPPDQEQLRIGIAVYELSGDRVVSGSVVLKRQAELEGRRYVLGGYRTTMINRTRRRLILPVPPGPAPFLVLAGMPDTMSQSLDPMPVSVDTEAAQEGPTGGTYSFLVPVERPHLIAIRARPDDTGAMVLAWYKPTTGG